jgi:hypothetical protein
MGNANRTSARHAAITNNLNKYRNYKDWAENIRGSWDEEK